MTIEKSKESYFSLDISNLNLIENMGYLYFSCAGHPLSAQNGTVPLHRHLISVHLGRWLTPKEYVYFRNGNTKDVSIGNLEVISGAELLRRNARFHFVPKVVKVCPVCNTEFEIPPSLTKKRRHCSRKCSIEANAKLTISPEELKEVVWQMPTTHIAEELGVSDKAIEKRCKKFGITKPPRGYWVKLYAGQIDPLMYEEINS
ncbi:MAG: hypothetical protein KC441_00560 [Anaerolineales bacterium]|nr:hypothetical protein [Anaerolineales bacterium]